jgi:cell division protein FtsN
MARDYKPAAPRTDMGNGGGRATGSGKKRGMNPMFVGIIIGLLLGIGLALSLAIWLNRANNPFIEKSRPVEALPTIPSRTLNAPDTPLAVPHSKNEPEKPRFEFYQILPGDKNEKHDKAAKTGAKAEIPPAPIAAPTSRSAPDQKPATKSDTRPDVKPASGEVLYLQAGAFQNQTDADNMKAKVAFAGFEAIVRPVNLPEKGTLYRVRLGPFKSLDEVNRIKVTLSQGGIAAAVVKSSD